MSKFKDIQEDIQTVTNQEVVKRNQISMSAIGAFAGAVVLFVGGYAMEDPNSSLSTFLFTAAVMLLVVSIIKLAMGRNCYLFRPTGSRLKKMTLYFDTKESQNLQSCLEAKRFDELKSLKRQISTGVKLDIMVAGDSKFAAVQVSEYVPYTYEAVSPVMCYYGDEAKNFSVSLGGVR